LLLGLLLLAVLAAVSVGASNSALRGFGQLEGAGPLELKTTIIERTYCPGDAELDALRMRLKLTYRNVGKQPIILYKGPPIPSREMISRSEVDSQNHKFEVDSTISMVTDGRLVGFRGSVPGRAFTIIQRGASFDLETTVTVLAVRGDVREITGAVTSGKHVLQIEVPTWPASKSNAEKMRVRWSSSGVLWNSPLVSLPMPFNVEKSRSLSECQ
jgi:hypothetical protein